MTLACKDCDTPLLGEAIQLTRRGNTSSVCTYCTKDKRNALDTARYRRDRKRKAKIKGAKELANEWLRRPLVAQ